jgi:integrase
MPVERTRYGTWRVRWTDPWGRQVSKTWKTKALADAHYRRVLGDMARGEYVDPRLGRITLAVWADQWLEGARNLSRGGHDTYRRDLDRHILPALGKVPVGKMSGVDVDRYLTTASASLAPSTVHRHYRTLHRLFEVARRHGLVVRNPCEFVEPPKVPRKERTALTIAQVDDLAAAISPRYRAWVYVMAYGGLRWSEAIGLRRGNVQFGPASGVVSHAHVAAQRRPSEETARAHPRTAQISRDESGCQPLITLRVIEQLVHRGRREWERTQTKTGKPRVVTLPGFAAGELAAHLERYSLEGPDGLVFPTSRGTPVQSPSFTANVFKRALRKARLPDVRIHDLRHTAVSLAIDAGANVKVSQARVGHASASLHLDVYGHAYEAADVAVAERLDVLRAESQRGRLRAV